MKNIHPNLAALLIALLVLSSCGGGGGGGDNGPETGNGNTGNEAMIIPPSDDGDGSDDGSGTGNENDSPPPRDTGESDMAETWRGLTVAPESRCSPYDRSRDYRYPQSVEQAIVRRLGRVYGPYTGTCFSSTGETDIEHIVATSEAHDSGLCARDRATRTRFARDLRNLTLAAPELNRYQKIAKDAAEWLPALNQCWFAGRIVEVRRAYGLTIDRREADALDQILSGCNSTAMEPIVCHRTTQPRDEDGAPAGDDDALARYDDNGDGRITCSEARRHGIAPVSRSHPAYRYMLDGDGDGVVCE